MIAQLLGNLGEWAWITGGMILLALEFVIPGVMLMWIGLAALAVGIVTLLGFSVAWWDWQSQAIVFAVLSLIFAVVGSRLTRAKSADDASERFNKPGQRLAGRSGVLVDGIDGGIGRVRLGDTLWRVEGPELPAGARVRVLGERDGTLMVEPDGAALTDR